MIGRCSRSARCLSLSFLSLPVLAGCSSLLPLVAAPPETTAFALNERDYIQGRGVGVMAFQDTAPESHQSGVIMVMHGTRIATNGDLRLEPTPGQWSPVPKIVSRDIDRQSGEIRTRLAYPDETQHHQGFNPLHYPDLALDYSVRVRPDGDTVRISVDLDQPLPDAWVGEIGFLLALSPTDLFGKSWVMDGHTGIFPRQPYGVTLPDGAEPNPRIIPNDDLKGLRPLSNHHARPEPMAVGRSLAVAPESTQLRLQIETARGQLELLDGRAQHQNGWFVVRTAVPAGATKNAIEWTLRPHVIADWVQPPTIQHSMVGYHPSQTKIAVIETDPNDKDMPAMQLLRLSPDGAHQVVLDSELQPWGDWLRYRYFHFDFSDVTASGMYQLQLGDQRSRPFRIAANVYDQNVWQPTLDYFLPVQMGHMRVKEKYKLWHDASHRDDAVMAPVNINHFDGYVQGPSTLTRYKPMQHVPGLAQGGWYDAGDEDYRIESQTGEIFMLSVAYEEFDVQRDNTLIHQGRKLVEIREPDGQPDILQQIDHGLRSVVGAYNALGRLYRGIVVPTLSQYVMGGDFSGQTDNRIYDPTLSPGAQTMDRFGDRSSVPDDRWVFTEENPAREFDAIANIAASVKPMLDFNPQRAKETLSAAESLWRVARPVENEKVRRQKIRAAVELWRATGKAEYRSHILAERAFIIEDFRAVGWAVARVVHQLEDASLTQAMRDAAAGYYRDIEQSMQHTPYGLSFEMQLWGRGWSLQRQGVEQYFLHQAFPQEFGNAYLLNVLHYVLGTNPGANNQSYVSGVGAKSKLSGYGINRMDGGYVPGGVVVGTALIQPDFPELKDTPWLWQQSEYLIGGGASHFMFLALAADRMLNAE